MGTPAESREMCAATDERVGHSSVIVHHHPLSGLLKKVTFMCVTLNRYAWHRWQAFPLSTWLLLVVPLEKQPGRLGATSLYIASTASPPIHTPRDLGSSLAATPPCTSLGMIRLPETQDGYQVGLRSRAAQRGDNDANKVLCQLPIYSSLIPLGSRT